MERFTRAVIANWVYLNQRGSSEWNELFVELLDNQEIRYYEHRKRVGRVAVQIPCSDVLHLACWNMKGERVSPSKLSPSGGGANPKNMQIKNTEPDLFMLDLLLEKSCLTLRFDKEETRDNWFQCLQIYVCDHFDYEPFSKGTVSYSLRTRQEEATAALHSFKRFAVVTSCHLLIFENEEAWKTFLTNDRATIAAQKVELLNKSTVARVSLKNCIVQDVVPDVIPGVSSLALRHLDHVYTFVFADETELEDWVNSLCQSIRMFYVTSVYVHSFPAMIRGSNNDGKPLLGSLRHVQAKIKGVALNDEKKDGSLLQTVASQDPAKEMILNLRKSLIDVSSSQDNSNSVSQVDSLTILLSQGVKVKKYGRRGSPTERLLKLVGSDRLAWKSSSFILLQDILGIEKGCKTTVFKQYVSLPNGPVFDHCLSIRTKSRTLDLEFRDKGERDYWASGFVTLFDHYTNFRK